MNRTTYRLFAAFAAVLLVSVAIVAACVPADTRPVPASLLVTVGASEGARNGIATADGWAVSFDRVLVGIGRTTLSRSCARYSESSYDRVVEIARHDPQKVSVLYAIGHCDLRFRVGTPSSEAVIGEGATDADVGFMRTRGGDRWVSRGGVVLHVEGRAARDGVVKTFRFVFRSALRYSGCSEEGATGLVEDPSDGGDDDEPDAAILSLFDGAVSDAEPPPPEGIGVVMTGGTEMVRPLTFDLEEIFTAGGSARFDPFAEADLDGDGAITLEELARVPVSRIVDGGPFEASTFVSVIDAGGRGGRNVVVSTLGDYVYLVVLPRLLRYGDRGACAAGLGVDFGRDAGRDGSTDADAGNDADAATDAEADAMPDGEAGAF